MLPEVHVPSSKSCLNKTRVPPQSTGLSGIVYHELVQELQNGNIDPLLSLISVQRTVDLICLQEDQEKEIRALSVKIAQHEIQSSSCIP